MLYRMKMTRSNHYEKSRYLRGVALLILTCAIMLVCVSQRVTMLHQLAFTSEIVEHQSLSDEISHSASDLSPCHLSAHSLTSAVPLFFDSLIASFCLLILFVTLMKKSVAVSMQDIIPPLYPSKIHIVNCVFRE